MGKLSYLLRSAARYPLASGARCPNCGSDHGKVVDRKFIVTTLKRCDKHFSRSRRIYAARDGGDLNSQYELGFVAFKDTSQSSF